jgi:hypothetical protein
MQGNAMITPSAELIEQAADSLVRMTPDERGGQVKELLHGFGEGRAQGMGASGLSDDFVLGFELGLQVARTFISMTLPEQASRF